MQPFKTQGIYDKRSGSGRPPISRFIFESKVFVDASLLDVYNNLKKNLKAKHKITRFMESPGTLSIDESSRHKISLIEH